MSSITFKELAAAEGYTPESLAQYLNLGGRYDENEVLTDQDLTEFRKAIHAVEY